MRKILGAWGECSLDRKNLVIRDTKGREGTKVDGQYVGVWGESEKMRKILEAWGECCLDRLGIGGKILARKNGGKKLADIKIF
jgi:hypothetical protein